MEIDPKGTTESWPRDQKKTTKNGSTNESKPDLNLFVRPVQIMHLRGEFKRRMNWLKCEGLQIDRWRVEQKGEAGLTRNKDFGGKGLKES